MQSVWNGNLTQVPDPEEQHPAARGAQNNTALQLHFSEEHSSSSVAPENCSREL